MKYATFKTKDELIKFVNDPINLIDLVVSIVKDVTNGDWVLFYY